MSNIVVTPEEAIKRVLFAFNDVDAIRTYQRSIDLMDEDDTKAKNNKLTCPSDNDDDEDEELDINALTPEQRAEYEKRTAEERRAIQEKLEKIKIEGSHAKALQPIGILMGNSSLIQEKVIKPLKTKIANDENYGWNLEFLEIHSSELTKDFVSSLPKPKGEDGGVLVISSFSTFAESYSPNDQIELLRGLMTTQGYTSYGLGPVCTGWRIIFIENTEDKNIWWPISCVQYFGNKNCLYSYYVE